MNAKTRSPRNADQLKAIGFEVRAAANDTGEIHLYGEIGGGGFFSDGVTANEFQAQLAQLKGKKKIDVHIDSDGGDVFQAETMYALLRGHGAKITSYIDGHAASAASFLAMAGDEIVMAEPAFFMIHDAHAMAFGGAGDMRRMADLVERVSGKIAGIYASRTGQPIAKIKDWMSVDNGAGTWFDCAESMKYGFATRMVENLKVAANVRHPEWFPNLPAALRPNRMRADAALVRLKARLS